MAMSEAAAEAEPETEPQSESETKTISVQQDDVAAAFREVREYAMGNLDVDHSHLHPIAGLIEDKEIRDVLAFMAENYEPATEEMPRDFWETKFAQKAIKKFATDLATEAIDAGNLSQISYITGLPSYESDVSGMHAINQMVDWLVHSEQCKLIYLAALMGRGKTDFALTLLSMIHDHFRRLRNSQHVEGDIPEPEFATNFWVDPPEDVEIKEINDWDTLQEWADEGSSDDERWFVFDEASTELTAQSGANAQDVAETMGPFVKKMRKSGINMIVIGHDRQDIHVAIRSMADFVDKVGLKSASFYAGINDRQPQGHMFDVSGIPPIDQAEWDFDTDDMAEWSWGDDEEALEESGFTESDLKHEIAERGARLWKQTDLNQAEVAKALSTERISVSRTMISNKAKNLKHVEQSTAKTAT